jgi:hypothetical protein|uniref:Uncharacterized protein n=1 Tax=viral metagenome TaxID=1070528 RepID=A0A6C0BQP4_9ZZZZ
MDSDKIGIIMRQTTYTREETSSKLLEHNGDVTSIIREFVGGKPVEPKIPTTFNQRLYSVMRNTMGTG